MKVVAVVLALVPILAASSPVAAQTSAVDILDNRFSPASITVAPGTTVTWTHRGQAPHSVTADDGSFDSSPTTCPPVGCMQSGQTFAHRFDRAGSFPYRCKVHAPSMTGTVVVAAPTPTPVAPTPTARGGTPTPRGTPARTAATGSPSPTPTPRLIADPSPDVTPQLATPPPGSPSPSPVAAGETGGSGATRVLAVAAFVAGLASLAGVGFVALRSRRR